MTKKDQPKKDKKKNHKLKDLDAKDAKQVKGGSFSFGTPTTGYKI